jgi:hypothetical protein
MEVKGMKGNHRNPQSVIPVTNRKISRNRLKRAHGNNKIQKAWMDIQVNRCKKFIVDLNKLIKDKKVTRTKDTNRAIKAAKRSILIRLKKAQC